MSKVSRRIISLRLVALILKKSLSEDDIFARDEKGSKMMLHHHQRLAKVFSYTGAIIQAMIITRTYVQYKTSTNVEIQNPRTTQLPAVSLCFFFKFHDLYIQVTPDYYGVSSKTLGEMNELVPTWDEFVISCDVLDQSYTYRSCLDLDSSISEYMSLYSKCFSLFTNLSEPVIYEKQIVGDSLLFDVVLNTSIILTNTIGMFLTNPIADLDESLGHPGFVQFDSFMNNRATVGFKRTIIKSLPYPHETDCFDYTQLPCRDRKTCIKQCIVEASYQKRKQWVNRRYIKIEARYLDGRFSNFSESNVSDQCFDIYSRQPCLESIIEATMASQFLSPYRNNDTYHIAVSFPLGIEKVIEYVPVQSFIAYVCYVASVIGIWTQLSVIGLTDYLVLKVYLCSNCLRNQRKQATSSRKASTKTNEKDHDFGEQDGAGRFRSRNGFHGTGRYSNPRYRTRHWYM